MQQVQDYASACCGTSLIYYRNDNFNRCPNCAKPCEWKYEEQLIPWNEPGHLAGWAD